MLGVGIGHYLWIPHQRPFPVNRPMIRTTAPADTSSTTPDTGVSVEVVGDGIRSEGTYTLSSDSEIIDLIEAAGGLSAGAITSGINWNHTLYEGLTVTIPTKALFRRARSGTETLTNRDLIRFRAYEPNKTSFDNNSSELINLNEASPLELDELPGIGKVLAGRIVNHRKNHGRFEKVSDLKKVFGIGDVTFQEIRAKTTVD